MNYFRKTKFRESSLVIVLLVIGVIYFTSRDTPAKEEIDIQALIDAAVEEALANSTEESETTASSTTTTIPKPKGDSTDYESLNFCSSLIDKYNQVSYTPVAIEKPYSGQMVRDTFTVQGCSSTFETTVNWQLIGSASSPNRMPDDVRFGEVVASGNTSGGGGGEMKLFSFNIPTDQIKDGKYYLRVYERDESDGESRLKMSETYIPIVINNSFRDISTEFGCSNLIDTYNAISPSWNSSDLYVESIESPFPGEIISDTFEVVACGTSQEGGMLFELLDTYGRVVESMTDYAYSGMEMFTFELDTKSYYDGRYFIQFSEPFGDACCGGDGIWSRTVIPVFIYNDNPGVIEPPPLPPIETKEYTFKDSPVLNWYNEREPYYYKRTDEEIEQLNEYHSQEGNERILSITDSAGNKILNNVKIFFGTKSDVLNKGVGHYITSADPSMYKGNVSIAGYSKDEAYTPFEKLHTVSQGSKIRWTHIPSGTYWEYTVTMFFTAPNTATSVVRSVIPGPNANDATITLITEDINDSSKILVVRGLLTDGNETG